MATLLPPPQYDHPPTIPVIDRVLSHDEVQRLCPRVAGMAIAPGQFFTGCSQIINGTCYIWRVDDAATLRHERAHCSGWPGNHPGGW